MFCKQCTKNRAIRMSELPSAVRLFVFAPSPRYRKASASSDNTSFVMSYEFRVISADRTISASRVAFWSLCQRAAAIRAFARPSLLCFCSATFCFFVSSTERNQPLKVERGIPSSVWICFRERPFFLRERASCFNRTHLDIIDIQYHQWFEWLWRLVDYRRGSGRNRRRVAGKSSAFDGGIFCLWCGSDSAPWSAFKGDAWTIGSFDRG